MPNKSRRRGRKESVKVALKRRLQDRKLVRRFVRALQGSDKAEIMNA